MQDFTPGTGSSSTEGKELGKSVISGEVPSLGLTAEGDLECKLHHGVCPPLWPPQSFHTAASLSLSGGVMVVTPTYIGGHNCQLFMVFYASS